AAGLRADGEGRPAGHAWFDSLATWPRVRAEALTHGEPCELLGIAHHAHDARQCGDFVLAARGVAAGGDDARVGILAGDAANGLPRALIRRRRDRAGVDDHQVGLARCALDAAARAEILL